MRRSSQPKSATAREAIRAIPPRARALVPQGCGAPLGLMQAIADERGHFERLEVCSGLIFAEFPFFPFVGENIVLCAWQVTLWTQKLADAGKMEILPIRLSQAAHTFGPTGTLPADVALVQVSTPDEHGYVSLGASVSGIVDTARRAPLVIAEVNRQCPRTLGNTFLHTSEIDYLVDADYPLVPYRKSEFGDVERKIAENVAGLIPDGATIQTGIGAIPEALMLALETKKDLGVHSGTIFEGFIPLLEKGVVTDERKSISPRKLVTGEIMGGPELCRYVHNNPRFHFDSVNFTHNSQIVQQLDNFIAVNSAVEVDMAGQVASESVGPRQISGVGGQFDYVEAAAYSKGGKSVIALPSTAAKGKVSRIVNQLPAGSMVTLPRFLADYVVTEYGVASLKGKTMRQRADALLEIAHPEFRDRLSNEIR